MDKQFYKKFKSWDRSCLDPDQYYALYYHNPSAWVAEQTTYMYDKQYGIYKELHKWQKVVLNGTYSNKLTVVLKCRQSGFSTAICALMAHDVLFSIVPGVIFVSASKIHAEELMDKFYKCCDSIIDPRFKMKYKRQTRTECEFINGIKVRSLSSNPETMVGFTGCVVLDEYGRMEKNKSEDIWNSLYPTITTIGTRMYVISTPFGKHNIFYRLCTENLDKIQKSFDDPTSLDNISKRLIKVHYKDVPHVRKNIHVLKMECPSENIWKMQYELEFGEDSEEVLFPYEFLRDHVYLNNEEIIPIDIKTLLLRDEKGDFINTRSPLYV